MHFLNGLKFPAFQYFSYNTSPLDLYPKEVASKTYKSPRHQVTKKNILKIEYFVTLYLGGLIVLSFEKLARRRGR